MDSKLSPAAKMTYKLLIVARLVAFGGCEFLYYLFSVPRSWDNGMGSVE